MTHSFIDSRQHDTYGGWSNFFDKVSPLNPDRPISNLSLSNESYEVLLLMMMFAQSSEVYQCKEVVTMEVYLTSHGKNMRSI